MNTSQLITIRKAATAAKLANERLIAECDRMLAPVKQSRVDKVVNKLNLPIKRSA